MYSIKKLCKFIGYFVLLLLPFYFIAYLFFNRIKISLFLGAISTAFNINTVFVLEKIIKSSIAEKRFTYFVQIMNNHISINNGIIFAIVNSLQDIQDSAHSKREQNEIKKILKAIDLGAPYRDIINLLIKLYPCSIAKTSLTLMSMPEVLGDKYKILLKETLNRLNRDIEYRNTRMSQLVGNFTECITLCIMPITILIFLRISAWDFIESAYQCLVGQIVLLVAFTLLILSIKLIAIIFIPKKYKLRKQKIKHSVQKKNTSKALLKINSFSKKVLQRCYPNFLIRKFKKVKLILIDQKLASESNIYYKLFIHKCVVILFLTISNMLLIKANINPLFFLPVDLFIYIYPEYKLLDKAYTIKRSIKTEIYDFMKVFFIVSSVGYSLDTAFSFTLSIVELSNISMLELNIIKNKAANGVSILKSFEQLNFKFTDPELSKLLKLFQDFAISGSKESYTNIKLQVQIFEQQRFEKNIQKFERNKNNYILPMFLNLLSVILISIAPVLPKLQL